MWNEYAPTFIWCRWEKLGTCWRQPVACQLAPCGQLLWSWTTSTCNISHFRVNLRVTLLPFILLEEPSDLSGVVLGDKWPLAVGGLQRQPQSFREHLTAQEVASHVHISSVQQDSRVLHLQWHTNIWSLRKGPYLVQSVENVLGDILYLGGVVESGGAEFPVDVCIHVQGGLDEGAVKVVLHGAVVCARRAIVFWSLALQKFAFWKQKVGESIFFDAADTFVVQVVNVQATVPCQIDHLVRLVLALWK